MKRSAVLEVRKKPKVSCFKGKETRLFGEAVSAERDFESSLPAECGRIPSHTPYFERVYIGEGFEGNPGSLEQN